MEALFEQIRAELDDSGAVRDALKSVVAELDVAIRIMHAGLMPIHQSTSTSAETVVLKVLGHLPALREQYRKLADIIKAHPGQYYRYQDHWRSQTQTVVSVLAFLHWLNTRTLLSLSETEGMLGSEVKKEEFQIDLEQYLIGICNFSSELPRFVVNRVTAGDYDCPREVAEFLSNLYSAFRVLNFRNDTLRKCYDGMKYDLKKVEEVRYDVKIRGLAGSST